MCVFVCVSQCMFVCIKERERGIEERVCVCERDKVKGYVCVREIERERERVCESVCVCVCLR